MSQPIARLIPCLLFISIIFIGCGAGSNSTPPSIPAFSSVPVTTAVEGTLYTYQLSATSPDMGAIAFSLTAGPTGASLSGNTLTWTPTHAQSRIANQFSVTATDAKGGSASQSWSVTPNGTIQIKAVFTYWTPTGTVDIPRVWLAGQPYPAALVPQSDGSLTRLQGAANPDGTFGIPDVPAGFYWLQLSPFQTYWTSTSDFDAGVDVVGSPLKTATQSTTTLNVSLSGLDPIQQGDLFPIQSNTRGFELALAGGFLGTTGATTLNITVPLNPIIDFSSVNTLFFRQMEPVTSGGFSGLALGPALTQPNVTITNGATNNISATLTPSPQSSIPLNIKGSAWANSYQNVAPTAPLPLLTDFSVSAQPFVTDRIATALTTILGPNLTMLVPTGPSSSRLSPPVYTCGESSGPLLFPTINATPPPILTDQDFGAVSFGDPFPQSWPRIFQFCQHATVQLPRPNSTLTDTFLLTFGETTPLRTAPIAPLVGPVQNPTINGASIFQSGALSTTAVNLSWSAPTGTQPFGYYVTVFQLATLPTGATQYVTVARLGTAKTSMSVPLLNAGSTYVFQIVAGVDGIANMETSPNRSQLPIAHSTVISAPITIN